MNQQNIHLQIHKLTNYTKKGQQFLGYQFQYLNSISIKWCYYSINIVLYLLQYNSNIFTRKLFELEVSTLAISMFGIHHLTGTQ